MSTTAADVNILLQIQSDMRAIAATTAGMRGINREVQNINKSAEGMAGVGNTLKTMASGVAGFFGIGFSASFIAGQVQGMLEWAGSINDLASAANMGTEAFQSLSLFFSENGGLKMEQFSQATATLARNLQAAAENGADPLNARLRALNLTAVGLKALAPERQYEVLGRAIANAADKQAAYNTVTDLLGAKNAPKLIAALQDLGVKGFDEVNKSMKDFGLSKAQLQTLDDAGEKFKRIWKYAELTMAKGFLGALNKPVETVTRYSGTTGLAISAALAANEKVKEKSGYGVVGHLTTGYSAGDSDYVRQSENAYNYYLKTLGESADITKSAYKNMLDTRASAAQAAGAGDREKAAMLAYNREQRAGGDENTVTMRKAEQLAADKAFEEQRAKIRADALKGQIEYDKWTADSITKSVDKIRASMAADEVKAGQAALNDQIAQGEITLQGYNRALARVETSPFLTNEQKRQARISALTAENAQIAQQIANLEKLRGTPGVDSAALTAQQRQLGDRATNNEAQIAAAQPLGVAGGAMAGMVDYLNQVPTLAERARASVLSIADAMENGISTSLTGLINQTMTWTQALANIGTSVVQAIIQAFINMAAQWITQQIVMAIFGQAMRLSQIAAILPVSAAIAAAWAPAATAASIATLGGAAIEGAAMAKTAIVASAVGFAEGGYTGAGGKYDVAGIVHRGEFVLPADVTSALGTEALYGLMNATRFPSSGGARAVSSALAPASAPGGGAGQGTNINLHVHADQRAATLAALKTPEGEAHVVDIMRRRIHTVSANA